MRLSIYLTSMLFVFACSLQAQEPGSIKIEKRTMQLKPGEEVDYEVGTIFVRENRNVSKSRVIGVGFARRGGG